MSRAETARRDPARLVAPGTRARLELERGLAVDVVRGKTSGPTVWLWAARGDEDPSLQQALGELRDELDPQALRGATCLLLDGPAAPRDREPYPLGALIGALVRDTAGVVLLCGAPHGHRVAPHAAADLSAPRDRRLARALGLPLVAPPFFQPTPNRHLLSAPLAWLLAGEPDRFERVVVDVARDAVRRLLASLGVLADVRVDVRRPAIARTLVSVPTPGPGLIEPAVALGAAVAVGDSIAHVGEPGTSARRTARAPSAGIVLYARAGRAGEGPACVLARVRAGFAGVGATSADELGWSELVDLPELGVSGLPAKIDTGARTSALHVRSRHLVGRSSRGRAIYEIEVPAGGDRGRSARARVEVVEHTIVRDSGGHAERRPVIETCLRVGGRERQVRVSLTDRGDMKFPMLVGRTALDARTRIDPTRGLVTVRRKPAG